MRGLPVAIPKEFAGNVCRRFVEHKASLLTRRGESRVQTDRVSGGRGLLVVIRPHPAERMEATQCVQGMIESLSIRSRVEHCSDRAVMFSVWVNARMSASKFLAVVKRRYRRSECSLLLAIQIDDDWAAGGDIHRVGDHLGSTGRAPRDDRA